MTARNKEIWFPAKKYGWGWGFPIKWQGWLVVIIYAVLLIGGSLIAETNPTVRGATFVLYLFVITTALIGICWLKGEKPRWRWGNK